MLLVSSDYRTARLIEELLGAGTQRAHLVTYATWDAAAAQAVLDHPGCCVLLDFTSQDTMALLEYVRMSAPEVPIVLLSTHDDEQLALDTVKAGAQDYLVKPTLDATMLRRALAHATVRKRAEAQLAHQALHDQLTGLPNRALFLDRLGVALERARRSGAQLAVLFLDFDNFKQINDSLGHAAGDRLLAIVGERLSGLLRPMDTVARFGGDEFTFLFEDLTSEREVVLIADRICQAARQPIEIDGVPAVGHGQRGNRDGRRPDGLVRDGAPGSRRRHVPRQGAGSLALRTLRRGLPPPSGERIELEAAVRQAIEGRELRVHYRPTVALDDSREPSGVEALVRWQHPSRGLIAAREFMSVAEDVGLVIPIGRFVLEHALERLAHWRARRPDMTLSLNISPCQLHDPALPAALQAALDARELEPSAICLEIPEHAVAEDPETAIGALERLKAIGVRIALDDFGSGASSLSRLRELPVDELKLDESFIAPVGSAPEDASIVGALVELGHSLGLTVVAEGVETESQIEQPARARLRCRPGVLPSAGRSPRSNSKRQSSAGSHPQREPASTDRPDQWRRSELAAQSRHVAVDHVRLGAGIPDFVDRAFPRDHAPGLPQQQLQQIHFARGQLDRTSATYGAPAGHVERQVRVGPQRRAGTGIGRPPGQGTQPRHELLDRERLDQVVVRPCLQPHDAIRHGVARGQHQDRRGITLVAQASRHGEAVDRRHRHVEHDHVGRRPLGLDQRRASIGGHADLVALRGQRPLEHPAQRRVVVDDQDAISHLRRRGAGTLGTPFPALAGRTARTPTPPGRSATSRSADAVGPATR